MGLAHRPPQHDRREAVRDLGVRPLDLPEQSRESRQPNLREGGRTCDGPATRSPRTDVELSGRRD